jgi:4-amino-4-deoxy-L-arabinose transferase-like glycosyltransferase
VAAVILVVTAVFRLANLQDMPPGLARDETLNADIASFILEGRHALFFREGYGHEPLYHYIGAAVQPLFGDNFLAIRLPSVYLGLIVVAGAMAFSWRIWRGGGSGRGRLLVASLTGLFLAVSWWPIILSRVGLRPILEPVLLLGAFLCWGKRPYLAGFLLGLATYSYTAARVVLVIPFLMLVYLFLFRNRLQVGREGFKRVLITGVVALLVYLPLGLTLRADPTLQERVNQLSGPLDALKEGDVGPILKTTLATLGVFSFTGDPLSSYALPDVPLFGLLMSLFFYGGLLVCLSRIGRNGLYGLVLIWLGAGLLPSAAAADAPSLIRLVGAMPVVYLLPAMAAGWLYEQAAARIGDRAGFSVVGAGTAVLVVVLLAVNLLPTFNDGFQAWAHLSETRQKYQSVWLDISRHWRETGQESAESLVVADSWYEPVKADSLRRDYGETLPARWVQQGRAVVFPGQEPALLYVPEFAAPLQLLRERVGLERPLYRSEAFPSFAVYELNGADIGLVNKVEVGFRPPETAGTSLTLIGWETVWVTETAELELLTYWQVEAPLPWDTTVFAHLWDESGQAVAQHDTFDAAPLTLQPGDRVLQLQTIRVENAPENIRLVLGLYNLQSQSRWQRMEGEPSDAFVLVEDWQPGDGGKE